MAKKDLNMQLCVTLIIGGCGGLSVGGVLGFSAIFLPQLPTNITAEQKSWIGKWQQTIFVPIKA